MNRRLGGDASLNAPIREDSHSGEWQDWLVEGGASQETTLAARDEYDYRRKTLASDRLPTLTTGIDISSKRVGLPRTRSSLRTWRPNSASRPSASVRST